MADDRVGERAHAGVMMTGSDGFDGPKAFYILIEALPLCGKPTNLGAADASDIDHAVPGLVLRSSWRRSTLSNPPRVYWRCDRSGLCVSLSARPLVCRNTRRQLARPHSAAIARRPIGSGMAERKTLSGS